MLGELQPWFAELPSLDRFRREMDELFDRFFSEIGYRSAAGSNITMPSLESFFRDGQWVMRFDLPGVDPKDIDVSVAGNTLTVRASRERRTEGHGSEMREIAYGRFERSLTLPRGVDSGQIKANYQHGVLELTMPASPELTGRKIPVEIGMQDKKQLEHQAA